MWRMTFAAAQSPGSTAHDRPYQPAESHSRRRRGAARFGDGRAWRAGVPRRTGAAAALGESGGVVRGDDRALDAVARRPGGAARAAAARTADGAADDRRA